MPRKARVVVPDYPHHVTQRGVRRQTVFLHPDDWPVYKLLIARACARAATRVLAYCLMPNHVHFVMVPAHVDGLRGALADPHRRYAMRVNAREGWTGHLWQERFYSVVLDAPHLIAAVGYVERNPVRAGLCDSEQDWPWSSAGERAAAGPLLVDHELRQRLWPCSPPDTASVLCAEEASLRKHTRSGQPLGSEAFVERLEVWIGRSLRPRRPGPKPESSA